MSVKSKTPLIRTGCRGPVDQSVHLRRLIPAWIASGVIHVALVLAFLCVGYASTAETGHASESASWETELNDVPPPDLTVEDIGHPEMLVGSAVAGHDKVEVVAPANPDLDAGFPDPTASPAQPGDILASISPSNGPGTSGPAIAQVFDSSLMKHLANVPAHLIKRGSLGARLSGAARSELVGEYGGNYRTEAAVARGLRWIASQQQGDGHWDLHRTWNNSTRPGKVDNSIAATAFGLLPFLGAGQTHKPSLDSQPAIYAKNVKRGLDYLVSRQNREGYFGGGMYAHALATMAVCEAYGLTSDPAYKAPAQRAIDFIVRNQNELGGWRYNAGDRSADTSVVGWMAMALKSGQMAGLSVHRSAFDGITKWLDSVASVDGGQYGYDGPQSNRPTTTAIGLLCREYLNWGPRSPGLVAGVRYLTEPANMPRPGQSMYYHYYATQVLHHFGGPAWDRWNLAMRELLVDSQVHDATPDSGSFTPYPGDPWGEAGGRLMQTSLAVLTLEVYYRHLPLYRREMAADKP